MYAVIETGGKQYRVAVGQLVSVEKLTQEVGSEVKFPALAICGDAQYTVGAPLVPGAEVVAELVRHIRDTKKIIFKAKRRHNYRRLKGHRQHLSMMRIKQISLA